MGKINRVTMFKITKPEDIEAALEAYTKLDASNSKVLFDTKCNAQKVAYKA
jgi:hypothetical protein